MSDNTPNSKKIEALLAKKKAHAASLNVDELSSKIFAGDFKALSETITLIESTNQQKSEIGQALVAKCLNKNTDAIRIGITGVPGVGKSTFIESFGLYLVNKGLKVAVMAIDPSSEKSHGSILGDKTRMNKLAVHPNAFIRPTASSGSLGGVARNTRETIFLCEAAGFDIILIETVGVGQSETAVHSMTDFFLLLMLAGAGDELQGIKRGIMEMADAILITKADGENVKMANMARSESKNALHLFPANDNEWIPKVETVSSLETRGIEKAWDIVDAFNRLTISNGSKQANRNQQEVYWMNETVKENLLKEFYQTDGIEAELTKIQSDLIDGQITSYRAAEKIIKYYHERKRTI